MAQRGIREFDAKKMLAKYWTDYVSKDFSYAGKVALVKPDTNMDKLAREKTWLKKVITCPFWLLRKNLFLPMATCMEQPGKSIMKKQFP